MNLLERFLFAAWVIGVWCAVLFFLAWIDAQILG